MKSIVLLVGLCSTSLVLAASFVWHNEVCTYQVQFDEKQISQEEITNAASLLARQFDRVFIGSDALLQYQHNVHILKNLKLPADSTIAALRNRVIERVQFWAWLEATEREAESADNPQILLQFYPAAGVCDEHVHAMKTVDFDSDELFDWHNCANEQQPPVDDFYEKANTEFQKYLKNSSEQCSEL